eukprot:8297448-Pyramimonas_sp.AAC.1
MDSTPQGMDSTPQGMDSTPQGVNSTPQGVDSTPQGHRSRMIPHVDVKGGQPAPRLRAVGAQRQCLCGHTSANRESATINSPVRVLHTGVEAVSEVNSTPQGVDSRPQGVDSRPQGVDSRPQGVDSRPQG